jgi:hypothetical protein
MQDYVIEQKGFILIIVLLFLQMFVLLGFYVLQASWLDNKGSHARLEEYYTFNQLEQLLQKTEQNELSSCLIPPVALNDLKNKPISWWQTQSCAGNFHSIQYYYVFESLGKDSCAELKSQGRIAGYYRLTLMIFHPNGEPKLSAQSTMILPEPAELTCQGVTHQVEEGRQSWQLIEL